MRINVESNGDLRSSHRDYIASETESALEELGYAWEFDPGSLGDVDLILEDERAFYEDSTIYARHPNRYFGQMTDLPITEEAEETIREEYPFPVEILNEVGHLVSRKLNDRGRSSDYSYEDSLTAIFNEIPDARAISHFHPEMVENELKLLERNLEILTDSMYDDRHVDYLARYSNEPLDLDLVQKEIRQAESKKDFADIYISARSDLEEELSFAPVSGAKEYARPEEYRPPAFSEFWLRQGFFNFLDPIELYMEDKNAEFDRKFLEPRLRNNEAPEDLQEVEQNALEGIEIARRLEDRDRQDWEVSRDRMLKDASMRDTELIISREIGNDIEQYNHSIEPSEALWLSRKELKQEIGDEVEGKIERVRREHDIS